MTIGNSIPPLPPSMPFNVAEPPPAPPEMPTASALPFNTVELLDRSVNNLNRRLENALNCLPGNNWTARGQVAEGAQTYNAADLVTQTEAKRIRSVMWAMEVRRCCSVMAHFMQSGKLEGDQLEQLKDNQSEILRSLARDYKPPEIESAFNGVINSPSEFFDKLIDLIDLIKNGYLAGYEHIIKAYSDFFSDFNGEITAVMEEWIKGVNDGKEVELNAGALHAALTNLIDKYTHPNPASVLFPKPGEGGTSKEEAENWLKALGLPPQCLKKNVDGTWCVVIDTGPLWTMKSGLPSSGTVTWDTAKFNAWQTGFNAQEERMKNMLQSLTQKYSNANSYHDNFNKTLSAHLNQFADMLRAMLNF